MSVVRRDAQRRWAIVAAGVATACLLPVVVSSFSSGVRGDPARLRDLILASAQQPFHGYVEVQGALGLPDLPNIGEFADLLSGRTNIRAWYASPQSWRVAEVTATGETDTYRTADSTYVWDFESNLLTRAIGDGLRLPRAADLLPPTLARRLLQSGAGTDDLTPVAGQRVAGVAAAGLRWTPSDLDSTIGRVEVWADPVTGLPVRVDVAGRDGGASFTAQFQDLQQNPPPAEVLVPSRPGSAGYTETKSESVISAINILAALPLPSALAGRARRTAGPAVPNVVGLGAYGDGLSVFAVAAVPGRLANQTLQRLREGGGVLLDLGSGNEAYEIRTSLVNALIVRTPGPGRRRTYLLAGSTSAEVLRQAAAELVTPLPLPPPVSPTQVRP